MASSSPTSSRSPSPQNLPPIPKHYALTLTPSLNTSKFTGHVSMTLHTHSRTSSITLHASDLHISSTTISTATNLRVPLVSTTLDPASQTLTIILSSPAPANIELVVTLNFSGVLNRFSNTGWFLPHSVVNGEKSTFAISHLEPSNARCIFPCFDTPDAKAIFAISLVVPRDMTALSNMLVEDEEDMPLRKLASGVLEERKKIVKFQETPRMATYLLGFGVGEFDSLELLPLSPAGVVEVEGEKEVALKAYVPRGMGYGIEQCRFGLEIARQSISILSKMFEIPFPLPKLDLVLVPGMSGGMENWGMITLSIKAFLIAEDNSAEDRVAVTQTTVHEIAHQWIGNIVTPESWDDFWWKEGLCEWAELEVRDRMGVNAEAYKDFVSDGLQIAMSNNSWRYRHALQFTVGEFGVVSKPMFDETTYKGCAIFVMLANYVGKELFVEEVRLFLRDNAGGNAGSEDLWEAMENASGLDVASFVRPWVKTEAFPLVEVEEIEKNGGMSFKQSNFRMIKPDGIEDEKMLPIPLKILTTRGIAADLLNTQSKTTQIPADFYSVNADQSGFFRVAYTSSRLRRVCEDMCRGNLSVEDRIGLISNSAALAFSCHPSTRISDVLRLLQNFEDEESFFVWRMIISTLEQLKRQLMFEDEKVTLAFDKFWKHLVKKCSIREKQFTLDGEINEQRFKALMFGNKRDEKVLAAAEMIFNRFLNNAEDIVNPNVRADVFKLVLSSRGKREYQDLKSRLKDASVAERHDILCSLGHSQNANCIRKTIKRAISEESLLRNEMFKTIQALVTHAHGVDALAKFVISGVWTQNPLLTREKMALVCRLVSTAFAKREQFDIATKMWEKIIDPTESGAEVDQCFDFMEAKARWLERDREDLIEWLNRNGYSHEKPYRRRDWFNLKGFVSRKEQSEIWSNNEVY